MSMTIWDIINEETINSMRPKHFQVTADSDTYTHNFALDKEYISIDCFEIDGTGAGTERAPVGPLEVIQTDKMTLTINFPAGTVAGLGGNELHINLTPKRV